MPVRVPILFMLKVDNIIWLCIDYKCLNKFIIKNQYPLLLVSEFFNRFNYIKIFIKLDFRDACYRIYIKKEDEWKTAFKTCYSHFKYLIMPFGLANAFITF